ncbi:MAG TPA: hypothetical protein VKB96_16115 [Gammaproteobacteria bacterium]|nr:hypothetical protein [Gammaproteobacteria bacterium]
MLIPSLHGAQSNTEITEVLTGDEPQGDAFTPDNKHVSVANAAAGSVAAIIILPIILPKVERVVPRSRLGSWVTGITYIKNGCDVMQCGSRLLVIEPAML